jgi:glucose-1-phosphate cytidylyltransferase
MTMAVVLCGGRGTRAHPHTVEIPKPLMEIGGQPIVRHVLEIYAQQGTTTFLLACGFGVDHMIEFASTLPDAWSVEVIDTGLDAHKGDRVYAIRDRLDEPFFVTYGDGVGNVDLGELQRFHRAHGRAATLTTVPLPSQYGTVDSADDGRVRGFLEKPQLADHRINAGFMVMEPRVFDGWSGDLEKHVLPALASAGELYEYRHDGFWKSMDTYKDALDLDAIIAASDAGDGKPPWLTSKIRTSS